MKRIIIILSLCVGLIILIFIFSGKENDASSQVQLPFNRKENTGFIKPRKSLKQSKYILNRPVKSVIYPKECHESLKDLSAMTAEEYKDLILSKNSFITFFGDACYEKLKFNPAFQKIINNTNCKVLDGVKQDEMAPCLTMMFVLKASFIADQTDGKVITDMTSQELAAHFVKIFFEIDHLNQPQFQKNLKLIKAFYDLHPNDSDVLEAYLGYMMIGKQITQDDSVGTRIDDLMQESSGESFKVDRLQILRDMLKNDLSSAKQNLDRLSSLYPKEPELAYYQASYYWKQGNREMANAYMEKAISMGASCSYCNPHVYKETKKKMANAKNKDEKIFSLSIGLNFENL